MLRTNRSRVAEQTENYAVFKSVFHIRLSSAAADTFLCRTAYRLPPCASDNRLPALLRMGRADIRSADDRHRPCRLAARQTDRRAGRKERPRPQGAVCARCADKYRPARSFQVYRFYHRHRQFRIRMLAAAARHTSADRHQLFHISGAVVYNRRLSRNVSAAALVFAAAALHILFSATEILRPLSTR